MWFIATNMTSATSSYDIDQLGKISKLLIINEMKPSSDKYH